MVNFQQYYIGAYRVNYFILFKLLIVWFCCNLVNITSLIQLKQNFINVRYFNKSRTTSCNKSSDRQYSHITLQYLNNMAQSIKIDFNQWSKFDHHSYSIINEDFIHERLFRVNANIIDARGRIRLQQTLLKNQDKFTTTGQTNIWFPIKDTKSLYFQIRNKGFRVHFDNGLIARKHLQFNIYGSVQADRRVSHPMYKIGCETISENWKLNLRYRYCEFDQSNTLYSRWRFDYKNFTLEGIKVLSLKHLNLIKNNFLIGYYNGNQTYHIRVGNNKFRDQSTNFKKHHLSDYFDEIILNYTKTVNQNQRFGVESKINIMTGFCQGINFVFQNYDPLQHQTLKLKFNSNMNGALSLRNRIGQYGTYLFGVGLNNIGSENKFKFGVQVNLNI